MKVKELTHILRNDYITGFDVGVKRKYSNNRDWQLNVLPEDFFTYFRNYEVLSIEPNGENTSIDIIVMKES